MIMGTLYVTVVVACARYNTVCFVVKTNTSVRLKINPLYNTRAWKYFSPMYI